jgi:glycoside/pentoside/hexuronide:cation symporter, GPH family
MSRPTKPEDRLKLSWLLAYSLPGAPIAALGLPIAVHLPAFYASEIGLGWAAVGTLFALARIWDLALDPLMGVISDKWRTPWGRRRVWMVLAIPVMIIPCFWVFMPEKGTDFWTLLYAVIIFYIGWTMLTITHLAWGGELTPDYHERSRITASREAAYVLGMIAVIFLPIIIQYQGGDKFLQIEAMGWFVIVLLPIAVLTCVYVVPERDVPPPPQIPLRESLAVIWNNYPLRLILFCDLISGISGGIVATLFIPMATVGLGLGGQANVLLMVYFLAGVLLIPLAVWVSYRLGKHVTMALSCMVNVVLLPCIFLVPTGDFVTAAFLWTLFGMNATTVPFLFRAIMADVADQDHAHSGQPRAGLFFSLLASTNKLGLALALVIAGWSMAAIGFDAKAVNPPEVVQGLELIYILPATVINLIIALVMVRFPLNESRQREFRQIIEERQIMAAAAGAATGRDLAGPGLDTATKDR